MKRILAVLVAAALIAGAGAAAQAVPSRGSAQVTGRANGHAKPQPKLVREWQSRKAAVADAVARGRAAVRADGTVRLKNGVFVDYRLQGTDHIVTLLAEFTDPQMGQISEPDRSTDNTTYWVDDFSRQHYLDMLFAPGGASYGHPSMRDYYLQQSSGRYTVEGQVSKWLSIPYPESEFGANGADGDGSDNANGPVFRIVDAALQATAGVNEGIDWSPSVVDVWDRYDCDGDGNFDESDGYVDHFQLIHAGEGEEAGGGAQGGDAIWSHRWYANFGDIGISGPDGCLFGGYQVPGTDLWVGDYTIEPENGGVGVFSHEFGHDLGLPDLYDTSGLAENATGFWTLMSSGSWASDDPNALDTKPTHMGAWEKLVLGWEELATVAPGQNATIDLGPAEGRTRKRAQAIRVNLPNYSKTTVVFPPEGSDAFYYYSGKGDDIDTMMRRSLGGALGADAALEFRTQYDIESDWDYAYVEYSSDGGASWTPVETNLSTTTNPNGQNFGFGITGSSGGWVDGSATIPAGATNIGFRYWTDGAVQGDGFAVDSIVLDGGAVDTAEDPSAWTFNGFSVVENGEITTTHFHYYLVESRNYLRNDESLRGAYNFVWGNYAERQPYADGVLIWYRNSGYPDNNVGEHPGYGQVLPVDSHPAPALSPAKHDYWRTRWQMWDATFGFKDHSVTLHEAVSAKKWFEKTYNASAVSVFRDSSPTAYWDPRIPYSSVKTAGSGVVIKLMDVSPDGASYEVKVSWSA